MYFNIYNDGYFANLPITVKLVFNLRPSHQHLFGATQKKKGKNSSHHVSCDRSSRTNFDCSLETL